MITLLTYMCNADKRLKILLTNADLYQIIQIHALVDDDAKYNYHTCNSRSLESYLLK